MNRPWIAEQTVEAPLARALIEAQFPELAPARLRPFGSGWDNTAFLVNDAWVFRFPRKQLAVPFLEVECRVLPRLAPLLTLPIPQPQKLGVAAEGYPWPFAGYPLLPGRTACVAALDEEQRLRAVEPVARFLAALHAIPTDEAIGLGAMPDTLNRLDVAGRTPLIRQWLEDLAGLGLVDAVEPFQEVLADAACARPARRATLVHGDLYARHLLVDEQARPCGVIDWGDLHLGDPAIDLALVCGFFPPSARAEFQRIYGAVEDDTWRLARFKTLLTSVAIVAYGHDTGDAALLREGRTALSHLVAHSW